MKTVSVYLCAISLPAGSLTSEISQAFSCVTVKHKGDNFMWRRKRGALFKKKRKKNNKSNFNLCSSAIFATCKLFFCTCAFSGNLPLWTNSFASQRVKRRSWRFVYTDRGDGAYVGMKLHLRRIILFMFVFFFFLFTSIDVTHVVQMYTHIQLTTHLCSSLCSECVFASVVFTFMVVLCASQMEHISVYLKNECKHLTSKIATQPAVHFFTPERETAHLHSKTMCCSILVCSEPRDSLWAVNIMFSVTSGHSFRSALAILWKKYTFYPRTVGMFCVRCQSDSF